MASPSGGEIRRALNDLCELIVRRRRLGATSLDRHFEFGRFALQASLRIVFPKATLYIPSRRRAWADLSV